MRNRRQDWRKILEKGFVLPKIDSDTSLPDTIKIVTKAVEDHLSKSKSVRSYLACLPKGEGTYCPNSKVSALQYYVSSQTGEMDKSDLVVVAAFMREIIMPVFDFERRQVLKAVKMIDDISSAEKTLLRAGAIIARATDYLWVKWFEAVVVPFQKMTPAERQNFEEQACGYLSAPDYTVFDYNPATESFGGRKTWAEAFPREINIICRVLKILKRSKLKLDRDSVLPAYFKALRHAYGCVEIGQLKKCWKKVDRLWFKIHDESRILPVHSKEYGYEHPCCISPEFRLEVRIPNENSVFSDIRVAVESRIDLLVGKEDQMINDSIRDLQKIEFGMFECAIRSGEAMNFPGGGEMVSNSESKSDEGGKILMMNAVLAVLATHFKRKIRKYCTSGTYQVLRELINRDVATHYYVGHEFSHLIAGAQDTKLDEAKATTLSILTNEHLENTPEKRLQLVAVTLGYLLGSLENTFLNNLTMADYVNECLVLSNTLFRSGVIKMTENGLRVNLEQARSRAWFEQLEEFVYELLLAYRDTGNGNLERLAKRYCKRTGPVAELIAWINRD